MKKAITVLLILLTIFTLVGCGKDNNNLEPVDAAISKTTDSLESKHTADIRKDTEDKTVSNELKDTETADKMLNDSLNKDDDVTDMLFWVVFYDWNGMELQRDALMYGAIPSYRGALPSDFDKWVCRKTGDEVTEFVTITTNTYFEATYRDSSIRRAGYGPIRLTVAFDVNGHGEAPESQTVIYGGMATRPDDPSETGYRFDGWYKEESCVNAWDFDVDVIKENTTIYAKWTPRTDTPYEVKHYKQNVDGSYPDTTTYVDSLTGTTDTSVTPDVKDVSSGDFYGFNVPESQTITINGDGSSLVNYYYARKTHVVTFDMKEHGTAPDEQTIMHEDKAIKPTDPSEEGYRFDGWYKEESCVNAWDFETDVVTEDTTLYAGWTKLIAVTFDMGGHGSQIDAQYLEKDSKATRPDDPSETGYRFDGWYKEESCVNAWDFDIDAVAKDTTLYAGWTKLIAVTFDMGGHGTQIDTLYLENGSKASRPKDPAEAGYLFCGWYEDSSFEDEFDFDSSIAEDTTVYASWKQMPGLFMADGTCYKELALDDSGADASKVKALVTEPGTHAVLPLGVTSIADRAFDNCGNLASIELPDGVASIGRRAFYCSGLESAAIPEGVKTVGFSAFSMCGSLESAAIPKTVESIDLDIFFGCDKLKSISVDVENAKYDSRGGCNAIIETSTDTLIQGCGSTVIPGSVKAIGDDAFRQLTSMETIAIPDSVESIGRHAFANCISADPITIPSGVKTIETGAFNMVPHIIYSGTATYNEGDEFWGAVKMN